MIRKILFILLILCPLFSCMTTLLVDSNVESVDVYIEGKKRGTTPFETQISSFAWYDPEVVLKKKGYKDLTTVFKKDVRVGNIIAGIVFIPIPVIGIPSFLTCYGPKDEQYFEMVPLK